MKINRELAPESILQELEDRMIQQRISMGLTQADLARQAGVSKRTVERIENGSDTQLSTLIRLLRVLNLVDRLDILIPENSTSPMELLEKTKKQKKKQRMKRSIKTEPSWKWGDES